MEDSAFTSCVARQSQANLYISLAPLPGAAALHLDKILSLHLSGSNFTRNSAFTTPSSIYFEAHSTSKRKSLVRDTVFDGNTAQKDVTISALTTLGFRCRLGGWMADSGNIVGDLSAPECYPCAAGYTSLHPDRPRTNATCDGPCPPGSYCPEGTAEPLPCPNGTSNDLERGASIAACRDCYYGQFQPEPGSTNCSACPAGSYSAELGQTECALCPAGGYCEEAGAKSAALAFRACPAGTFNPEQGSTTGSACIGCPSGTVRLVPGANGSSDCEVCGAGTYAERADGQCIPCPHPSFSGEGSTTCSICKPDYYHAGSDPAAILASPAEECRPCPPNANCSAPGATLATLAVSRGYWRASPLSAVLTKCRAFGGSAKAGEKRCAGSEASSAGATDGRRAEEAALNYCAPDFSGPECQLCAEPNHHLVDGDRCKQCLAVRTAAGQIAALAVGVCIACGLALAAFSVDSWRNKACIGPLLRLADRAVAFSYGIGLIPKSKVLLGFYQICIVLSTTYSVRLPERYTSWTDKVSEAVSIDWSGTFLPPQCLPYWSRLVAVSISPVGVIALLLLAGVGLRLHQRRLAPSPRRTRLACNTSGGHTPHSTHRATTRHTKYEVI